MSFVDMISNLRFRKRQVAMLAVRVIRNRNFLAVDTSGFFINYQFAWHCSLGICSRGDQIICMISKSLYLRRFHATHGVCGITDDSRTHCAVHLAFIFNHIIISNRPVANWKSSFPIIVCSLGQEAPVGPYVYVRLRYVQVGIKVSGTVCDQQAIRNGLLIVLLVMLYIIMTSSDEDSDVTSSYSLFILIDLWLIDRVLTTPIPKTGAKKWVRPFIRFCLRISLPAHTPNPIQTGVTGRSVNDQSAYLNQRRNNPWNHLKIVMMKSTTMLRRKRFPHLQNLRADVNS